MQCLRFAFVALAFTLSACPAETPDPASSDTGNGDTAQPQPVPLGAACRQDADCIAGMLQHGNLLICGWDGQLLVGVSRCVTDFHYACYLSDLAVDSAYQGRGIGIKLQQLTQEQLGPRCKLVLLAAPAATEYYPRIGYSRHESCWIVDSDGPLGAASKSRSGK